MKIAVIGGGASGLVAAGSCKGVSVTLFERGEKVGKKIYITGKGRCNFTNVCDSQEFLQNVVNNAPFLRSAISKFTPNDAIELLENNGCQTKVERGRRAFPLSDKASDVTKALISYVYNNNVEIKLNSFVDDIKFTKSGFCVSYRGCKEDFDRVIVCTGGKSYPLTGSDGNMYDILSRLGHTVNPQYPSLVGLVTKENLSAAEGLTLKNVSVCSEKIKPIFGDLMITDTGISGPIALTHSAYAAKWTFPYKIYIDFKPAMTIEELDTRILRDFDMQKNKQFKNALDLLLPKSVIPFIIDAVGILPERQINSITKTERRTIVQTVKHFPLTVIGNEGYDRAVVTCGGIDVKQVDPKTMQSRIVPGLYFGGEVLDIDALTGGYNFHIALATGFVAGVSASEMI